MSGLRPVLVTGFGPFLNVHDNPSGALARAMDGRVVDGRLVIGRVLPVSYRRSVDRTLALIAAFDPVVIIGTGVARGRTAVSVEQVGRARLKPTSPDVDGVRLSRLPGADVVTSPVDVPFLADALGALVSTDAGGYVCNAWLHQLAGRGHAVFLHLPESGLAPARLSAAIGRLWPGSGDG